MSTQTFNISLPKTLVQEVDGVAKKEYLNRSEFIRQALRTYLNDWSPEQNISLKKEAQKWRQSFGAVKPLTKKLSFKTQRKIAWEDKINAAS